VNTPSSAGANRTFRSYADRKEGTSRTVTFAVEAAAKGEADNGKVAPKLAGRPNGWQHPEPLTWMTTQP
jgi:hypothetical protein